MNHGVLCGQGLLKIQGNQWSPVRLERLPSTMAELCAQCLAHGLSHLWVMADTGVVPDKPFFEAALEEWDLLATWKYPPVKRLPPGLQNPLITVVGCKRPRGGQKQIIVIFCASITKWHWLKKDITPRQLLLTITYLERALEVPVGSGPSTVGMKLLTKIAQERKHPEWIARPNVDLTSMPWDEAARDLIWERPFSHDEKKKRYLHKIDKNSAYLRACVALQFGVGDPVHEDGSASYSEKRVGIWRCSVKAPASILENLPPVWDGGEWIAGPIIKLLQGQGYEVAIHEGWIFPKQHEVLRAWAEKIWEVRQAFKLGSYEWARNEQVWGMAYVAVKDVAVATIGLTQSRKFEEASYKQRPDWHCQVVAGNRSTVYYNLLKVFKASGRVPLLVNMDALYYVSDERDPAAVVPELLGKENSLGGYKAEWKQPLELTEEAIAVLESNNYVTVKLEQLNKLRRAQMSEVKEAAR
jgi:hypothetical protein